MWIHICICTAHLESLRQYSCWIRFICVHMCVYVHRYSHCEYTCIHSHLWRHTSTCTYECIHTYTSICNKTCEHTVAVCCSMLQYMRMYTSLCNQTCEHTVAVCCSVLQYMWMYTSLCNQMCEHTVAVCCSVLQCVAIHVNVYIHMQSDVWIHTCQYIHPYAPHAYSLYVDTRWIQFMCAYVCLYSYIFVLWICL